MNKVRLGRTRLMVTPVCFGASGLGDMPDTYGYGVDAERAKAELAYQRGLVKEAIDVLSTADASQVSPEDGMRLVQWELDIGKADEVAARQHFDGRVLWRIGALVAFLGLLVL